MSDDIAVSVSTDVTAKSYPWGLCVNQGGRTVNLSLDEVRGLYALVSDTRPEVTELVEALRDAVGLLEMHGINRTDLTPRHAAALSRISKHKE